MLLDSERDSGELDVADETEIEETDSVETEDDKRVAEVDRGSQELKWCHRPFITSRETLPLKILQFMRNIP